MVLVVSSRFIQTRESIFFCGDKSVRNKLANMNNEANLDEMVWNFCGRIVPDYRNISSKLKEVHPEWSVSILAENLMEFGRGEISQVEDPREKDFQFANQYVGSLNLDNPDIALFTAYAGGCIMGLVQSEQLPGTSFIDALKVSAHFAQTELKEKD